MNRLSSSINPALATLRTTLRTRSLSRGRNRLSTRRPSIDDNEDDDNNVDESSEAKETHQQQNQSEATTTTRRIGSSDDRPESEPPRDDLIEGLSAREAEDKLTRSHPPIESGADINPTGASAAPPLTRSSTSSATNEGGRGDKVNRSDSSGSTLRDDGAPPAAGTTTTNAAADYNRSRVSRGRSRSRVRNLLQLMKGDRNADGDLVDHEPTSAPENVAAPDAKPPMEDVKAPTTSQQLSRGRSRSRVVRRMLLSRGSNGVNEDDVPAAVVMPSSKADESESQRPRPAPPQRTKSSGARSIFSILTSSRSVAEGGDNDAPQRNKNRAKSTSRRNRKVEDDDALRKQQPSSHHHHPFPIKSDVIVETPESRKVMRNISRLGMEDPVLRRMKLDELNGAAAAAAAAAAGTPTLAAGCSGAERHQQQQHLNDPSTSAAASFSERMSQQLDEMGAVGSGVVGARIGGGLSPKKQQLNKMPSVNRPSAGPVDLDVDDDDGNDSVDWDGFDDGLSIRSDPTATSDNDGIDMVKFRRVLHRTPSTRQKDGHEERHGDEHIDVEVAISPRKAPHHRSVSKRSVQEEIQVSPQRIRGTVKGLKIEDFQAALDRHQQQQQQHHHHQQQLDQKALVPGNKSISKESDLIGGDANDGNDDDDDDSDPLNGSLRERESSSGLMAPYALGGSMAAAPYSPKTPKFDTLGSSSSWHSRASTSRRGTSSDLSRASSHTNTSTSSKLAFLPGMPLDSESMHSQSTVAASTSTVEVCNSSSRQQKNQQHRRNQKQQQPYQPPMGQHGYNSSFDKDYRMGAGLLDLYSPASSAAAADTAPVAPPFLNRAISGPGAGASAPPPTLSRRHSITTTSALAASSALSPSGGVPGTGGGRVVVKVRVKKRTSLSHAPSPLSPASLLVPTSASSSSTVKSGPGTRSKPPPIAVTGGIGATGGSSTSTWQAPFAPMPMEPALRKSSLKLTTANPSTSLSSYHHLRHPQQLKPQPQSQPHPLEKAFPSDPSSAPTASAVLTSSLRRKKSSKGLGDAPPSSSDAVTGASSSSSQRVLDSAAALDPLSAASSPSKYPSTGPSSSRAASAAQELMSYQRVLPTNMDTIFAYE